MGAGFIKDEQATLDYTVDWSAWLPAGDTVTAAAWTVPDGLTELADPAPALDAARATVWLSGGTAGQTYPVTCRVTTAQGRVDERTIRIRVDNL